MAELDSLDAALRDLMAERYGPTDRMRARIVDDPDVFERRRAILNAALGGHDPAPVPANVVPIRSRRAA